MEHVRPPVLQEKNQLRQPEYHLCGIPSGETLHETPLSLKVGYESILPGQKVSVTVSPTDRMVGGRGPRQERLGPSSSQPFYEVKYSHAVAVHAAPFPHLRSVCFRSWNLNRMTMAEVRCKCITR